MTCSVGDKNIFNVKIIYTYDSLNRITIDELCSKNDTLPERALEQRLLLIAFQLIRKKRSIHWEKQQWLQKICWEEQYS